ncbi:uncharacterized protein A4U43_C07F30680 [Asparagus officinalis]|uniref:Uncharacterized protein n=1 Tax=Asparagus officinalis TaxID=4686 RepID=A0A5P1EG32_ASPOF|nr:uncharacterized protein A4U43_C07F30680 [Asparagus officinalis]
MKEKRIEQFIRRMKKMGEEISDYKKQYYLICLFSLDFSYLLLLELASSCGPDALPATADVVKEASIAWTDLMASVRAENDADLSPEKRKVCPFLVRGNGSCVEIPYGLVQDSAVTVVGTPIARNRSSRFGFELVGDGNGMVVRVNVSIEGGEVVIGYCKRGRRGEWLGRVGIVPGARSVSQ